MSLVHDFFLLYGEVEDYNLIEWYGENRDNWENNVKLEDSIINYMYDTLEWIKSYNPELKEEINGLNYNGLTVIRNESSKVLFKIIHGWIEIFSNTPNEFEIKNEVVWRTKEENDEYWDYNSVRYEKTLLLERLSNILLFCEKAQHEKFFILHCGI